MKTMIGKLCCGAIVALLATGASAQNASYQGPEIPPSLRHPAPAQAPAASGDALQKQAMLKLRRRFEEADLDNNGRLTEDEAKRAGLGFIADNFAAVDSARMGAVSFDDVQKYLAQRRK